MMPFVAACSVLVHGMVILTVAIFRQINKDDPRTHHSSSKAGAPAGNPRHELKPSLPHAPRSERRLPSYAGYASAGPLPSAAWAAARRAMGTA
jgi:hypothetical protein